MKKFKVSIIIPVYNTEKYLEETLQSVIAQTIGFEENLQLILINNATEDRAGDICVKYRDSYPDNVKYLELKNNIGVSGARNKGIDLTDADIISFLDSDDKWALDGIEIAYDFFVQHYDVVDFVACRTEKFDAEDGYVGVDYKFDAGTRIVDIMEEPNAKQFIVTSSLIKTEAAKRHRFDERLRRAEDVKMINEILMDSCKYGIIKESLYLYRIRGMGGESNVQTLHRHKNWYIDVVKHCYLDLINISREKYGVVLDYLQYIFQSEMRDRIPLMNNREVLTEEENKTYEEALVEVLKCIRDEIIISDEWLSHGIKEYELLLKYNESALDYAYIAGKDLLFERYPVRRINKSTHGIQKPQFRYLFPFSAIEKGEEIYIYGAGDVGTQYIRQIKASGYCIIKGVIDKRGESVDLGDIEVFTPKHLAPATKNKIIIAICNQAVAETLRNELTMFGIKEDYIIWDIKEV